jgi:hypothetical protein
MVMKDFSMRAGELGSMSDIWAAELGDAAAMAKTPTWRPFGDRVEFLVVV